MTSPTLSAADQAQQDRISALTSEYLGAMMKTAATGGRLEDNMSAEGVSSLQRVVGMRMSADNSGAASVTGAFVPTVTKTDENGRQAGYDLFSLLMTERIVTLNGPVDDSMAAVACASLLYLDSAASGKPGEDISVYINSPGGSVLAGFAIIDTMETISSHITTVGMGLQASMGSHLLAAGDTRLMTDKSLLMIHGASSGTEGKVTSQANDLNATERMVDQGHANYVRHIGLTAEFWELCDKEAWFSAEQAKKIGFIDGIVPGRQEGTKKAVLAEKSAAEYLFNKAAKREAQVPKSEEEIIRALGGSGPNAKLANEIRPEMLVALAQMPKYWTPELKAKKEAEARAANDNTGATLKKQVAPGV